jgi:hypothetical protein
MPLTNQAKQQLRNFYKKVQNKKKKRVVTVSRATSANNKSNKGKLSPRRMTTKTGRKYLMWNESKGPSGITYSIQTIRPNSRQLWNKKLSVLKL